MLHSWPPKVLHISLDITPRCTKTEVPSKSYVSIVKGAIRYQERDGSGASDGVILYVKPTFYRDQIANVGIRNYGTAHPEFPHETTADQWFTESQFESYRALGFELMCNYLDRCAEQREENDLALTDWFTLAPCNSGKPSS